MAKHPRIANAGIVRRELGDWAETETAQDILRSLEMLRSTKNPAVTMIAGAPGVGKTDAVKRFCAQLGHDAIYIQAARGKGTAWNFARSLAGLWGGVFGGPSFNTLAEAGMLLASYIGTKRLLVIDEAQYLDQRHTETNDGGGSTPWKGTAELIVSPYVVA